MRHRLGRMATRLVSHPQPFDLGDGGIDTHGDQVAPSPRTSPDGIAGAAGLETACSRMVLVAVEMKPGTAALSKVVGEAKAKA